VDAEKLTRTQIAIINSVDLPIVYSRSALYAVTLDTNRFDTKLIYHGVDSEKFKPVEDKEALKAQFGLKNKFIVGSVNRNVTRKNFPALIKAFAKFAENKNDVLLYLHTKPNDFLGHNLYEFISECGIQDKVLITKDLDSVNGIDTEDLVKVYNLFDLHVTCSAGEGLGLSILESELCGVPNLATDFSACREFVTKNMRIAVKAFYYEGFQWNTQRAIVDEDDLVNKLNTYYKYRGILPLIGEQHRKYIETFDWKYIEALWKLLFIQNGCKDNDILSDFIRI
jgi:glycosyltransferase involved in cell wall biosynthesis